MGDSTACSLYVKLFNKDRYIILPTAPADAPVKPMHGGDLCASLHRGYEWWMIQGNLSCDPAYPKLPLGIVVGLKHSINQKDEIINLFGKYDPCSGPDYSTGFKKQIGGDYCADEGHGYYWYESTGEGFSDWSIVD